MEVEEKNCKAALKGRDTSKSSSSREVKRQRFIISRKTAGCFRLWN